MKVALQNVQIPWNLLYTYCLFPSPFLKEIISQNENDVVIEDIFERRSTTLQNVQIPWSRLYTYCLFPSPFLKERISQNENDVVIEDIFERSSTTQRNVSNENIEEEDGAESEETSDKNGHVVKHEVFQNKDCIDQDLDPKIRKGLKKIQKLDAILADKLQVTIPLTSEFVKISTLLNLFTPQRSSVLKHVPSVVY